MRVVEEPVYSGLEPAELWRHFAALNRIPRPSGSEAAALEYARGLAAAAGAEALQDPAGNLSIRIAATEGAEALPAVAVQAHLDMVCQQRPGVGHDFHEDPIRPRREGDWLYATGTTLGADNGIGAAAALALLTDSTVTHGPLELLLTVEEETGLIGAQRLDPALLTAPYLINLDSEDPTTLTVGCAGGGGVTLTLQPGWEAGESGLVYLEVEVSGLKGGHSGVQIHQRLANATKLLVRTLNGALDAGIAVRLGRLQAGTAHNAIPRDAVAGLAVPTAQEDALREWLTAAETELLAEWSADEPGFRLSAGPALSAGFPLLTATSQQEALTLLTDLPHGVLTWSQSFPGKVETSCNLAVVRIGPEQTELSCSVRSFVAEELRRVQAEIQERGAKAGASVEIRDGYPGWEPNPSSHLLAVTREAFQRVMGREPEVEVIHAGLECGVLAAKRPGLEAISFGPRIEGAHTPEERVYIPDVATIWRLLTELLRTLA